VDGTHISLGSQALSHFPTLQAMGEPTALENLGADVDFRVHQEFDAISRAEGQTSLGSAESITLENEDPSSKHDHLKGG